MTHTLTMTTTSPVTQEVPASPENLLNEAGKINQWINKSLSHSLIAMFFQRLLLPPVCVGR